MLEPNDFVTAACATFTIFGALSLFVSSKPVTLGAVVMTVFLAIAASQVAVGISASSFQCESAVHDAVQTANTAWKWVVYRINMTF